VESSVGHWSQGGQQSGVVSGRKDMLPYFLVDATTQKQDDPQNHIKLAVIYNFRVMV